MAKRLVLVLGDQLSPRISSLRASDKAGTIVLMAEVAAEAGYVPHHKKKIAFIFSAMRHFAAELREAGWTVDYVTLDDPANSSTLAGEIRRAQTRHGTGELVVTEPGEWRVLAELEACGAQVLPNDLFLCSREEFASWAEGRKSLRMEYFYRLMRQKTGLLMAGNAPEGGQWNFDHENRKPASASLFMPQPLRVAPDAITQQVLELVERHFPRNFGDLEPFWFPVTRTEAERAARQFIDAALPSFGDYQDAMLLGHRFLFHSLLSPLINVGLLDPIELCRMAEAAYRAGKVPLNSAEGFIRQIIGWREYVRGIYWREGPDYARRNALEARRALPSLYWTGKTRMACMAAAIGQTREEAYAHHIQRLMVTGNFALLAGIDPHALHEWYLAVYADAFEWVEVPNTVGMSQHADGGLLASKPYAASGAYINRMSDYCRSCHYTVSEKTGDRACPFNALYWHFLDRHRQRFAGNPRMAQMYRTWDRMDEKHRRALLARADRFLHHLDQHGSDCSAA
ncbi:cryptochrome/photolyase family protein [Novosphingobium sp. TH158]|uniref:cryptochrome/photolyase family protein n=1 Tax=Novosphingobium sp. TH158 TaxID=2067455 RepID=UPI000C7E6361|nr:cryptochrome/photolyase family protein [Novosphingobium sp. TH158]PLK25725.1 cryptochrome/photolyase family protein [Novosphingobium sp. TH158]